MAKSAGKLFFNPPSTSTISFFITGAKAAGIDILALMASANTPLKKSYSLYVTNSVAAQANLRGRVLKSV